MKKKLELPWVVYAVVKVATPFGDRRATIRMAFATEDEMNVCRTWVKEKLALGLIERTEAWNWVERTMYSEEKDRTYVNLSASKRPVKKPVKPGKTKSI